MFTELQRMDIVRTSTELENTRKNPSELKYTTEVKKKKNTTGNQQNRRQKKSPNQTYGKKKKSKREMGEGRKIKLTGVRKCLP